MSDKRLAAVIGREVPVVEAIGLALWPPAHIKGRRRMGPLYRIMSKWHWDSNVKGWEGTLKPPPGVGLRGCANCRTHNAVSNEVIDQLGGHHICDGCGAVLTKHGTWI